MGLFLCAEFVAKWGRKKECLPSVARRRGDTGNIHPRSRQTAAAIEKGGAWQSRGSRVGYTWKLRKGQGYLVPC